MDRSRGHPVPERAAVAADMSGAIPWIDPRTGETVGHSASTPAGDVAAIVTRAHRAQEAWYDGGLDARKDAIQATREAFLAAAPRIVAALADESGRPAGDIWPGEIVSTEDWFGFWLGRIDTYLSARPISFHPLFYAGKRGVVHLEPKGVVGLISPWNLPVSLPIRVIIPALLAGNAVVWKASEHAPRISQVLYDLFAAHLPADVLALVQGDGEQGPALVDTDLDALFFTGSVATGRAVAARAAGRIRTLGLELGGKDAAVVLPDADLDRTVHGLVWGAFFLAGQNCASIERCYVHESIHDEVVRRVVEATRKLRPLLDVPPLRTADLRDRVHRHVTDAVAKGARLEIGGEPGAGFYYPPTVLTGATPEMAIFQEETFGPVLPIRAYDDIDEAAEEINAVPFGLTGSVWTKSTELGEAMAGTFKTGVFTVNNHGFSGAIPSATWGGRRDSGHGVSGSEFALYELTTPRTVVVEEGPLSPAREPWWFPYNEALVSTASSLVELVRPGGRRLQGARGALTGFIQRWKDGP
jgi:acyl-CoA reductase-like NAD-dependent aldehyde dehydrogenase